MLTTDRNYWTTYRDSIAFWGGDLPPSGKLGVERVFEFARHILETAEREQVMRVIFVPALPAAGKETVPTWLELMRAKFEQEGGLRLFPAHGLPDDWLGGQLRQSARLAYYRGDQIVEEDVEDVGDLEKAVVTARGGDPQGIRSTLPIVLYGGAHNEPDQPLIPSRPPTRAPSIYLALYTDIWFPRVVGLDVGDDAGRDPKVRHPARGRDGLMDNSALAARHTPRLNRFIETLRGAILDLGGTWDEPDADPSYKSMVHGGGILLGYSSARAYPPGFRSHEPVTATSTLAEDVLNAARRLGVVASALAPRESAAVHRDIATRYGHSRDGWPLWDGRTKYPVIQDPAAWRRISDFVHDQPCLLLWEPSTERAVVRIERGQDLIRVLDEVHRSEFYVTDPALSFMFCFNRHDFLVAGGRAASWLEARRRQQLELSAENAMAGGGMDVQGNLALQRAEREAGGKNWDARHVADLLGVSELTVKRMARKGRIPAVKIGRAWVFSPQKVRAWLHERDAADGDC